ncbi:hypothetical protein FB567DRAFT_200231 [Paraphoma chrysanthemicola]|uniref:Uncharacterized protein n=1 Tax=Paraphoma chrysanthemicola TaxID=798071 RepID=A0A8K0VTJ8_9PLEO|nr:hypothetical protein FB567DRAFT_200231 [Paraphoma chrysanthemicola]
MSFELARKSESYHLIPQSSDLELKPPESYFFITDFLIISCGVLYTLCYTFYTIRTYSDRYLAGTVQFLSATMAYEIYYAYVCTTTTFQRTCFFVWFLFDITFVVTALKYAYNARERRRAISMLAWQVPAWGVFLWWCGRRWPDEREQKTAFWTGLYLELPIGWGQVYYLVKNGHTKGQSLEIWITRYLGCITAFLVFIWRYYNVPENWAYVANSWSVGGMIVTLLPETVYPFFYVWAHRNERKSVKLQ